MGDRELTPRQKKFIEVYNGNGTEAARQAGYKGSDDVLGKTAYDLLRNPRIKKIIDARLSKEIKAIIATRTERQEFWSNVMKDGDVDWKNRLRASELLGRSEADFIEKHEHSGRITLEDLLDEARKPKPQS